jgi:putative SOS response-associated peptidase YedK
MVPFWMKAYQLGKKPFSTINARSDRVKTAPTYREPFKKRRCLVPAIDAKTKQPFHFQPQAKPFAFTGVCDVWNADGRSAITSFSIVTTAAAPSAAAYHDRMPVVLEDGQFADWMRLAPEAAAKMMKPYAGEIDAWAVPKEVGNVRNNRPELMERGVTLAGGIVGNG